MPFFRSSRPPRLCILGLDGSPLPLLRRLMQAGDLPNLARVFESGTAVEMDSSLPDVSAVAWTSINTGKNPGKHGIYGFVDRRPGSMAMEIMTSRHVRAKTIWELASEARRRAIAVNVPLSFPPQQIDGVVISDFLATSLEKAVYPPSLIPSLQGLGYRIDTDPAVAQRSLDLFLDDFKITAEKRGEAIRLLMDREPWHLLMAVFMETDRLHHFLWQYMEEDDPKYGPRFREAYQQVDRQVGLIVDKLHDDDALIILSDHGFTTLRREVYLNAWLEQEGYLSFNGGERGLGSISDESRVYSLDPGRLYLNLSGREPRGSVSEAQAPALLEELAERLQSLREPVTGQAVVERVYRGTETYTGPEAGRAPDLLAMPRDGFDIKGTFDATTISGRGKLVGMHKYDNATLFIRNARITVEHASVWDVLPTACRLMKMACPEDVDGKVVIDS